MAAPANPDQPIKKTTAPSKSATGVKRLRLMNKNAC